MGAIRDFRVRRKRAKQENCVLVWTMEQSMCIEQKSIQFNEKKIDFFFLYFQFLIYSVVGYLVLDWIHGYR